MACLHYHVTGYLELSYPASCPSHPPFIRYQPTQLAFAFPWNLKYSGIFTKSAADTISLFTLSDPHGVLYRCEVPFINRIRSFVAREAWLKPVEEYYGVLSYFDGDVAITEDEGWRRQRRVGGLAYYKEMFTRLWVIMQENWEERMAKDALTSL